MTEEVKKKLSPFDFINAINFSKQDLWEEDPELADKSYNAFIINRGLSMNKDTVLYAAEISQHGAFLPARGQFDYLRCMIRKGKRYSKWSKKSKISHLEEVKAYYNVSEKKALQFLKLLTPEQLEFIVKKMTVGD